MTLQKFRKAFLGAVCGVALLLPNWSLFAADGPNGFDLSSRNVALQEIQSGGPGNGLLLNLRP